MRTVQSLDAESTVSGVGKMTARTYEANLQVSIGRYDPKMFRCNSSKRMSIKMICVHQFRGQAIAPRA